MTVSVTRREKRDDLLTEGRKLCIPRWVIVLCNQAGVRRIACLN